MGYPAWIRSRSDLRLDLWVGKAVFTVQLHLDSKEKRDRALAHYTSGQIVDAGEA